MTPCTACTPINRIEHHSDETTIDDWLRDHCYDCGGSRTNPGPRDVDHVLCFVSLDELTPEQRAKVRLV